MSAAPSGSLPPLSEEERAIFANAIRQARMLQRTLGPLCEVAIHDFRDLEHSLIHLEGSLTGRKLGAPITNIVVKAWRQQGDDVADIVGYPSSTPGGKSLKSSTSFLRRADGRVIGAFCMNIDLSDLLHFQAVLHPLLHVDPLERDVSETFAACTGDTSLAILEAAIRRAGKHPSLMNREEKKDFIRILDEEGAFLIKGVVQHVAKEMQVPVFRKGELVYELPTLEEIRVYCAQQVDTLWDEVKRFDNPHNFYVDLSRKLWEIKYHLLERNQ